MMINSNQLKKLMKREFKDTRLTIGNIDGGYSIMGGTWIVHVAHEGMPNIVKSLVIELAGILPEEGEIVTVSKDSPAPQIEMDTGEGRSIHVVQRYLKARRPAFRTHVYAGHGGDLYGLVQSNMDGKLCHVRKELLDMIDLGALDHGIESPPGNPCYISGMEGGLIWHNATTTLLLLPSRWDDPAADVLRAVVFDPHLEDFLEEDEDGE